MAISLCCKASGRKPKKSTKPIATTTAASSTKAPAVSVFPNAYAIKLKY